MATHGVNNGQALKSAGGSFLSFRLLQYRECIIETYLPRAVWFRQSHDLSDLQSTNQRITLLYTYHGQPDGTNTRRTHFLVTLVGVFSCSEHLAGLDPSQGAELCTIVETMYSFEVLSLSISLCVCVFCISAVCSHGVRLRSFRFSSTSLAIPRMETT
jgi:hypothetical protein